MTETDDLRRIIKQLDEAAKVTAASAKLLALAVEETRLLAEEDRVQMSRLILLVQRLTAQGEVALSSSLRLEKTAGHVAEDLKASIIRADMAPTDLPGAGADAALRSPGPGETAADVAAHEQEEQP